MTALKSLSRGLKGDLKWIVRDAAAAGWKVTVTGGTHVRMEHPEASRPVYAPISPRGQFAGKRLLGEMRRALRREDAA